METIEQLKAMRDAAKARIEALPDYKLMTKLSTLIGELEEVFGLTESGEGEGSGELGDGEAADEETDSEAEAGSAALAADAADVANGTAQAEVEETVVTDPVAESPAGPSAADIEAEADGSRDEHEDGDQDEAGEKQDYSLDTDAAIRQAMAELEADLSSADLEAETASSQYRYGNSS